MVLLLHLVGDYSLKVVSDLVLICLAPQSVLVHLGSDHKLGGLHLEVPQQLSKLIEWPIVVGWSIFATPFFYQFELCSRAPHYYVTNKIAKNLGIYAPCHITHSHRKVVSWFAIWINLRAFLAEPPFVFLSDLLFAVWSRACRVPEISFSHNFLDTPRDFEVLRLLFVTGEEFFVSINKLNHLLNEDHWKICRVYTTFSNLSQLLCL